MGAWLLLFLGIAVQLMKDWRGPEVDWGLTVKSGLVCAAPLAVAAGLIWGSSGDRRQREGT